MGIFGRKKEEVPKDGRGIVLIREVSDAMRAEKVLRKAGFLVRLVAPPPEFREGCDLAVEIDIMEKLAVERVLAAESLPVMGTVPLGAGTTDPVSVVSVADYDGATMVRAGNMKMTFERLSGRIVNVSGGGCPDVPYLYARLVGANLRDAAPPRETGFTLCALMLDRAFEECLRMYREKPSAADSGNSAG